MRSVLRTGAIRVNGALAPSSIYQNGQLYLRDRGTGEILSLAETRARTYSRKIVPGAYDVLYSHLTGDSGVPRNELAVIAQNLVFAASGALDIDIPMVRVQGALSLDGAPFTTSIYNRARFWLQGKELDDRTPMGLSIDQSYGVWVVPGTYDVAYEALQTTGVIPENAWTTIRKGQKLAKAAGGLVVPAITLDIDVESDWLDVDFALWGDDPYASIYQNGLIMAVRGADRAAEAFELGATRTGGAVRRVIAGSYLIRYAHLVGDLMPRNGDASIGLLTATPDPVSLAVDLRPGDFGGAFTQGGAAFPALSTQAGELALVDRATGDRILLGKTMEGPWDALLLGGTFDVVYTQLAGASVPANRGATLGCVKLVPSQPE